MPAANKSKTKSRRATTTKRSGGTRRKSSYAKGGKGSRHRVVIVSSLLILVLVVCGWFCRGSILRWLMWSGYRHETSFVPAEYDLDGATFIGNVRRGKPHGPGVLQLDDGTLLAGTWRDGKRHGVIRECDTHGQTSFSRWADDRCLGIIHPLQTTDTYGIDISRYQPEYWSAMLICANADGSLAVNRMNDSISASSPEPGYWLSVDFVIIKASGGRADIDPRYQYHSSMAELLLIPQGAYHVINTHVSVSEQVEVFLRQVQDKHLDIPPVLDIEGSTAEIPRSRFDDEQPLYLEWLQQVEQRLGIRPIVYCCRDFYQAYGHDTDLAAYDFWIADYSARPQFPSTCRLRQVSETGRITGWDASVDIDRMIRVKRK